MARNPLGISHVLLTLGCFTLFLGCSSSEKPENKPENKPEIAQQSPQQSSSKPAQSASKENVRSDTVVSDKGTTSKQSKTLTPSPPRVIPKVGLSDSLRATCLVNVGEVMPMAEVIAPDGGKISLPEQYGKNLTVLFFWSKGETKYAQLQNGSALQDLQSDVADQYAVNGLKVIGIYVGPMPDVARQQIAKADAKYPYYFDPSGALFSKVAKEKLPRVYLLDASGKIIWFDTEYSISTRRNLGQAIQVSLGEK
jgi:peroxiredoxin